MSDAEDDQIEPSDDEDIDDMIYSEICADDDSDENISKILDDLEYEVQVEITKKDNNKHFMGNIINIDEINKAKNYYLNLPKYNEILAIYIHYNNMLQKGSMPFIDEIALKNVYSIDMFNNQAFTPEMASMINLIIMNIPICTKIFSNIYNRDCDDINTLDINYINVYYYIIKKLLRSVMYNINNKFNFDILNTIFPIYIKNINIDIISNAEIAEISNVKNILTNNFYEKI